MSSEMDMSGKSKPSGISRREAVKLAAAVAGFGSVLGFNVTANDAQAGQKAFLKGDRLAFKFFRGEQLLHTFSFPITLVNEVARGERISIKFWRNDSWSHEVPFDFRS